MLDSIGQVFAVNLRAPVPGLRDPLELMAQYPCVYDRDGSPSESTDYLAIVYVKSDKWLQHNVMDALRGYGPYAARYITNFYREGR